jgi:hypothetical protein
MLQKFTGEIHMVQEDYMLMLGANIYANPTYTVLYQADRDTETRIILFTLENGESSLNLTTEILDENSDLIAKIDKNKFIQVNEKFEEQGKIEEGNGLTLTKKDNGAVILNARITEDGYVVVTGTFHVGGKKIYVADRAVEIDGMPRQTINGVKIHDSIFVGTPEITLTNDGVVLSADKCCK